MTIATRLAMLRPLPKWLVMIQFSRFGPAGVHELGGSATGMLALHRLLKY